MTATLGGSLLVILLFFGALGAMLGLAVRMESTLQRPDVRRWRVRIPTPGSKEASAARRTQTPRG